ncbi:DUF4345 family protein [Entomomonas asaccharolytica]|uniref:DUF4345 family protein n=1 Tax=Entomomonas asaccharolytica TaxID=2785331 RepID=A0A974RVU0_9GAMM|nr:DUF4345 family protein [Entomomonas asaccharolytica]QQP84440.1 DUF4345 family protein [Entomomonas asaccharolytica]
MIVIKDKAAQIFLAISGIIFIVLGLMVGLPSEGYLSKLFNASINGSELHIFRTLMGIYLALGSLFIYGCFSKSHVHILLNVELVVVTGLIAGLSFSLLVDGYHHWSSVVMLLVDIVLFSFCIFFLFKSLPKNI